MEGLKENIKAFRLAKNWTQEALAEEIGKSSRMISAYERGESDLSTETVYKIAQVLGVTVEQLYGAEVKKEVLKVSEPQTAYIPVVKESKKVSIELDLNKSEDLSIFRMFLGNQYAAKLA